MDGEAFPSPEALPRLGDPCTADKQGPVTVGCGTDGKVALVIDGRFDRQTEKGCTPKVQKIEPQNGYEVKACIEGHRLLANARCFACRLYGAGWGVAADIDRLTPAQLLAAQKQLGFQSTTPYTTTAAWSSAIAARSR